MKKNINHHFKKGKIKGLIAGLFLAALSLPVFCHAEESSLCRRTIVYPRPFHSQCPDSNEMFQASAAKIFQYPDRSIAPVPQDFCEDQCGGRPDYDECLKECARFVSNIFQADADTQLNVIKNIKE